MPLGLKDGDLIRGPDGIKVYVVNAHGYKRHIPNPSIFAFYKHLRWEDIKSVDQQTLDYFVTSTLYRAVNNFKVFTLEELASVLTGCWLNMAESTFSTLGFDWQQIFIINEQELDYYQEGDDIRPLSS